MFQNYLILKRSIFWPSCFRLCLHWPAPNKALNLVRQAKRMKETQRWVSHLPLSRKCSKRLARWLAWAGAWRSSGSPAYTRAPPDREDAPTCSSKLKNRSKNSLANAAHCMASANGGYPVQMSVRRAADLPCRLSRLWNWSQIESLWPQRNGANCVVVVMN